MKINLYILSLGLAASVLFGCSDELTQVGSGIQPDDDVPSVYADTFYMTGKTLLMDSVYAKTAYGTLGEIYDPLYGNLKSDFLCQFYCPDNFRFRYTPADGKIDSVEFKIMYTSWIGDSLTPMRAQIYEVTSPLTKDFYTNINPGDYCNLQKTLGMKTYTSHAMNVPDSVRYYKNSYDEYTFQPNVTIRMSDEIGQRF